MDDSRNNDSETHVNKELGLAGTLFEVCSDALGHLITEPTTKVRLNSETYRSLSIQAHRLSLWGDGFDTEHGALDRILEQSSHLKKTVIYFLNAFGKCLISLANQLPTSSQPLNICQDILRLQQQVESAIEEPENQMSRETKYIAKSTTDEFHRASSRLESLSLSDSESSTSSNDIEETVEDLTSYLDCLLDLVPALENPAMDYTYKERADEKNVLVETSLPARIVPGSPSPGIPLTAWDNTTDHSEALQGKDLRLDRSDNQPIDIQREEQISSPSSELALLQKRNGEGHYEWIPTLHNVEEECRSNRSVYCCIATTRYSARCRIVVPASGAQEFLCVYETIQASKDGLNLKHSQLEYLARGLLCARWHRLQASRIAEIWLKELQSSQLTS